MKIDPQLAKQFRDRWQAAAAIEDKEQRATSIGLRWKQLNAIWQLALGMGVRPEPDGTESLVRERWDTGQHTLMPWHQYSLSVLVYAYRAFEEQVGDLITAPGAKSEAVQRVIASFGSDQTFTVGDLERLCPTVSRATIKRVLNELRAAGQVECLGKGRSAHWRKAQISS